MSKEVISDKQGISIIVLFMTGTSTGQISGIAAQKDLWISIIISVLAAMMIALLLAYIQYIFPGKNLFDIIEICFGRFVGKAINIFVTWYVFYTGGIVLINMGYYIKTVTFPETPLIVTLICITLLCVWIIKSGIEVMGRWSEFVVILYCIVILGAVLMLIPKMNVKNLQPVFYNGIKPILKGAFLTFTFPFGEIVVFSMILSSLKTKKSPLNIYIKGLLIGGIIVLAISVTVILVLGINTALDLYYPSYSTIARIDISDFIQRLEILSAIIFIIGGFMKVAVYLLATCRGISKIFGSSDYRYIAVPAGLLFVNLAFFVFDSIMNYFEWTNDIWPYFALPFQAILPVIILIAAAIRKKFSTNQP